MADTLAIFMGSFLPCPVGHITQLCCARSQLKSVILRNWGKHDPAASRWRAGRGRRRGATQPCRTSRRMTDLACAPRPRCHPSRHRDSDGLGCLAGGSLSARSPRGADLWCAGPSMRSRQKQRRTSTTWTAPPAIRSRCCRRRRYSRSISASGPRCSISAVSLELGYLTFCLFASNTVAFLDLSY
jgi:hypothetical protein